MWDHMGIPPRELDGVKVVHPTWVVIAWIIGDVPEIQYKGDYRKLLQKVGNDAP